MNACTHCEKLAAATYELAKAVIAYTGANYGTRAYPPAFANLLNAYGTAMAAVEEVVGRR